MPEVHVFMAEGRSQDQKRAMMVAITQALATTIDAPPSVVTVQIFESSWHDKMKGGKTFAERYEAEAPSGYHAAREATAQRPGSD